MADDAAQSAPVPSEPAPVPDAAPAEPAAPVEQPIETAAPEPTPDVVEPEVVVAPAPAAESTPPAPAPQAETPAPSSPPAPPSTPAAKWSASDRIHATAKRMSKKEARLAKVVELAREKGRITNDDIEKLLHVSDATASRYGTILVQRSLLKREGKTRGAGYTVI